LFILPLVPWYSPQLIAWKKPSQGWFKLNTDGSSFGNPRSSGVDGIIKDDQGNLAQAFACVQQAWMVPVVGMGLWKLAKKLKQVQLALRAWNKGVNGQN